MDLETLIAAYGLPALAVGAAVEGEAVVIIGGAMVHRGLLEYAAAIAAAAFGSFLGDQAWFHLARHYRDRPRIRAMTQTRGFRRAQAIFARYPAWFVFGFRFIYGMRTVSPLAIGATDYPAGRFLLVNAMAAVLWAAVFISLGYAFGQGLEAAFGRLKPFEHLLMVLLVVGMTGLAVRQMFLWMRRRRA